MNIVFGRSHRKDERGAEAVAMIFVIPVLVILVLGLVDVGMMFRSRMLVENIARDAVRNAAADGGNMNKRTNTIDGSWDNYALKRLVKNGNCQVGNCKDGKEPTIDCTHLTAASGADIADGNTVRTAGDIITCEVYYPYKPINGELLNSPIGLGIGSLLKEFHMEVSARSETGNQSAFGSG